MQKKSFDQIQLFFMVWILNKLRTQGEYPNIIKAIYNKHTANIILNYNKLKCFPLESGIRVPNLITTIQHNTGSSCQSNQTRKIYKINNGKHWKRRSKILSICRWDYFIIENLKMPQKLLDLINKFSKNEKYKINTPKSLMFLYTTNYIENK